MLLPWEAGIPIGWPKARSYNDSEINNTEKWKSVGMLFILRVIGIKNYFSKGSDHGIPMPDEY